VTEGSAALDEPAPGQDAPFWAAAEEGHLAFQVCDQCGYVRWPAAGVCPDCLSRDARWEIAENVGTIWSFVVYHHVYAAALKAQVPYNVAMIELSNGVRLVSRIVGLPTSELRLGLRVEARFEPVGDRPRAPVFVPARSLESGAVG
jgi:uncharacterized OB-fold protein